MSRTPLLAGNWKMHGTRSEALALAGALAKSVGRVRGREVVLAPPYTALDTVSQAIAGTSIKLAAQNCYWEPKGAFTAEISAVMLQEAGCTYVIIGHSERRQLFGETNETVNQRVQAVIGAGLLPIICVGETLAEREADATLPVVSRQVGTALDNVRAEQLATCVFAYEPVWAIGTGKTATPQQAEEVHAHIRGRIAGRDAKIAALVRIQYGGSVKAANAAELFSMPNVDGGLIGGASLKAEEFLAIVTAARA
jgi:triosephosphate isomerase